MIEMVLQSDAETRPAASVREIDVAHPSKPKGTGFELEVVKVLQGYAIEAVKIPLSGSVAGFAGDSACSTFPATFLPASPVLTEGAMITYAPKWIGVHERSARGHNQTFH